MNRFSSTTVRVLAVIVAGLLITWAVGACGTPAPEATATGAPVPEATATSAPAPGATVSGTVNYAPPAEPVPGMVVIVQIQDTSVAGTEPTVVGEQRIADPGSVPVPFEVGYDPAAIEQSHSYVVHARVEDGSGTVLYNTMQNYAVITQGHATQNINLILEMIGGGQAAP